MTDGGNRTVLSQFPGVSVTRRTVLKVAGLVWFLSDGSGMATQPARATDGRSTTVTLPTSGGIAGQAESILGSCWRYAEAVAIDGRTALIGVPPSDDEQGPAEGRVDVLDRSGRSWSIRESLLADSDSGQFGRVLALSGDIAAIGSELGANPTGGHGGTVAVFSRSGDTWARQATLGASDARGVNLFGTAVAIGEDSILVGASAATTDEGPTGAADLFARLDGTWRKTARLVPQSADVEDFGRSVAFDGTTAVVGAKRMDEPSATSYGTAFVFTRSGQSWHKTTELVPPERSQEDDFGATVAMTGQTIVVGAPTETNELGTNAGAVHVFTRENDQWCRTERLLDEDGRPTHQFGTVAAIDGNSLLVGSRAGPGAIGFVRTASGWTRRTTVGHRDGNPSPGGSAVALDGTRALVGNVGGAPHFGATDSVRVFEP